MKLKWFNFFVLYILVPFLMVPLVAIKTGNWFLLAGSLFYFLGFALCSFKQWIFLSLPIIFCFWYWYTYGFSLQGYVSLYFVCLAAGVAFCEINKEYQKFVNKILPEQINNLEYDAKVEELNKRIDRYRKDHPNEKLTHAVVEKIRTDVFFQ